MVLRPKSTVIFFTESYPYDIAVEATFIEPQLPHLLDVFGRVIVVPSRQGGRLLTMPEGVLADDGLADALGNSSPARLVVPAIESGLVWRELLHRPWLMRYPRALRRLLASSGRAMVTRSWFKRFMSRHRLVPADCLAYTFWCDQATVGLALVKRASPELVVVSRVNGIDLFLDRHDPPYIPNREFVLQQVDRVFAVSEFGLRYVLQEYPWFGSRCEVSRLGVADPGFVTGSASDGRHVLVSCSGIVPVKRVDLIARAIDRAARQRPETAIDWHHFGDGELRSAVEQEAAVTLPPNARVFFHGYQPIDRIMEFYRTTTVDGFVSGSSSEGGAPVAIMEAISCGIPVIATATGGVPEIVSDRNGVLVDPNASPEEFAGAILSILDRPADTALKRLESRRVWEERFQARVNYTDFARRLAEILPVRRGLGPSQEGARHESN